MISRKSRANPNGRARCAVSSSFLVCENIREMSQLRAVERRLRRDNIIVHGITNKACTDPITLALTLIATTLGLVGITIVDAKILGRADSERRPLWVRLASESARRRVRDRAREVRPKGVYVDEDLCNEDREDRRRRLANRQPPPPPPPPAADSTPALPP